ncbi:MAG: hypothetical protein ACM3XQ_04445 [Nocardioidaceae bacterium]
MHLLSGGAGVDAEVPDQLLVEEGTNEVLARFDVGVGHLLGEIGLVVVLAGVVDLLGLGQQVVPGGDVGRVQATQRHVHATRVGPDNPARTRIRTPAARSPSERRRGR